MWAPHGVCAKTKPRGRIRHPEHALVHRHDVAHTAPIQQYRLRLGFLNCVVAQHKPIGHTQTHTQASNTQASHTPYQSRVSNEGAQTVDRHEQRKRLRSSTPRLTLAS